MKIIRITENGIVKTYTKDKNFAYNKNECKQIKIENKGGNKK